MAAPVAVAVWTMGGERVATVECPGESTVRWLKREIAAQAEWTRATASPDAVVELMQLTHETLGVLHDARQLKDLGLKSLELQVVWNSFRTIASEYYTKLRHARPGKSFAAAGLELQGLKTLCSVMREVFLKEPLLLELEPPLCLAGNLAGSLKQLTLIFDTCGDPPSSRYLFLGNYVHLGKSSLETFTLLLLCKYLWPQEVFILRGKHEDASISRSYGFYEECQRKFNIKTWKAFIEVFRCMPLCACLARARIFCVSSGLSPRLERLEQLDVSRPVDVLPGTLLSDLLWSNFNPMIEGWKDEVDEAVGDQAEFGSDVLQTFLAQNGLDTFICSQRVSLEGYERLSVGAYEWISVFSAASYGGRFENKGAVCVIHANLERDFVAHEMKW